jgi:hypothetical protein
LTNTTPPITTPYPDVGNAGVAGTPVTVAAGGVVSIPYPAQETISRQAVPLALPWVLVLNSSPFTLLIQTGNTVEWLSAFTQDLVQVNPALAIPLTVTALQGAAPVAAGSDTTVYTTWYNQKPPGSYPAALGAGSINVQVSNTFFQDNSGTIIPSGGQRIYGPVSCAGYASTRFFLSEGTGANPAIFSLVWEYPNGEGATREVVLPPNGVVEIVTPNLSDTVLLRVTNNSLGNISVDIVAVGLTQTVGTWNVQAAPDGVLSNGTTSLNNLVSVVLGPLNPYAGPAVLNISASQQGGSGVAVSLLADLAGNGLYTGQVIPLFAFATGQYVTSLLLPSAPTKLTIKNQTAISPITVAWSLIADAWRVG